MMLDVKKIEIEGYETVIEAVDDDVGLHAFIAVHNTELGPSVGGTRIYPYHSTEEALQDALRLSRGMTYKSAMAEIGLGGGKSVIIADPKNEKTQDLLIAFGKAIHTLEGKYICAEDVGSTTEDMVVISKSTPYVAALPTEASSGDPSPFTAWGAFRGIQAVAKVLWRDDNIAGRKVAIQGLGSVGQRLAEFLFWHGADLTVTDVDDEKIAFAEHHYAATRVSLDEIFSVECDIFAPCALGAIINENTVEQLQCKAIAGAANNQLASRDMGEMLHHRGILYAPDFVINAGGIINASIEFEPEGYNPRIARQKVDHIYDSLVEIFQVSQDKGLSPTEVADQIAESKIAQGVGKRQGPLSLRSR